MYQAHFGLEKSLFDSGIAQDGGVFIGEQQQLAIANCRMALTTFDSALLLTGPAGVGKTTLAAAALRESSTRLALGWLNGNPANASELLEILLAEFGFNVSRTGRVERLQMWRQFLNEASATDSRVFVIAERAEDLAPEILRALESLTTADPNGCRGANLVLLGQAGLHEHLKSPALESLRQRVRLRQRLAPLSVDEVRAYLEHHVSRVGGSFHKVVAADAVAALHRHSGGLPRALNNLCETALMLAASLKAPALTAEIVTRVAVDMLGLGTDDSASSGGEVAATPIANAAPAPVAVPAAAPPAALAPTPVAMTAVALTPSAPAAAIALSVPSATFTPVSVPTATAIPAATVVPARSPSPAIAAAPTTAAPAPTAPTVTVPKTEPSTSVLPASGAASRVPPSLTPASRGETIAPATNKPWVNALPTPTPTPTPAKIIDEPAEFDGGATDIAHDVLGNDTPDVQMVDFPVLTDAVESPAVFAQPQRPAAPAPTFTPPPALPAAAAPSKPASAPEPIRTGSAVRLAQHAPAPAPKATQAKPAPPAPAPKPAAATAANPTPPPPMPAAPAPSEDDDVLRQTQTMRALASAKSIDDISNSMAETLFGEADLDMLSAALASAGWSHSDADANAKVDAPPAPTPSGAEQAEPDPFDAFDLFGLGPDAPLELIDDSTEPRPGPPRKIASNR